VCGEDAYCAGGKLGKLVACPSGYSTAGLTIATTVEQCFVACDPGTYASIATGPAATCYSCGPGFFCAGGPQSACPSQISHGEGMAGVASFRYARVGRCFAPCLDEARKAFPSHPSHLISSFFLQTAPSKTAFPVIWATRPSSTMRPASRTASSCARLATTQRINTAPACRVG